MDCRYAAVPGSTPFASSRSVIPFSATLVQRRGTFQLSSSIPLPRPLIIISSSLSNYFPSTTIYNSLSAFSKSLSHLRTVNTEAFICNAGAAAHGHRSLHATKWTEALFRSDFSAPQGRTGAPLTVHSCSVSFLDCYFSAVLP